MKGTAIAYSAHSLHVTLLSCTSTFYHHAIRFRPSSFWIKKQTNRESGRDTEERKKEKFTKDQRSVDIVSQRSNVKVLYRQMVRVRATMKKKRGKYKHIFFILSLNFWIPFLSPSQIFFSSKKTKKNPLLFSFSMISNFHFFRRDKRSKVVLSHK